MNTTLAVLRGVGMGFMVFVIVVAALPLVALLLLSGLIVAVYFAVTEWLDERRVRRGQTVRLASEDGYETELEAIAGGARDSELLRRGYAGKDYAGRSKN